MNRARQYIMTNSENCIGSLVNVLIDDPTDSILRQQVLGSLQKSR